MSAVIWLGIVAVWGFVLIPRWVRRHDGAVEQRSVDRLHTAMRVLTRRRADHADGRYVVRTPAPQPFKGRPRRPAPKVAKARAWRRRLLLGLLFAVPVTVLLALVVGGVWIIAQLLADVGLVAYVAFLRRGAREERRLRANRARQARAREARASSDAALAEQPMATPAGAPGRRRGRPPAPMHAYVDEPETTELPPLEARAAARSAADCSVGEAQPAGDLAPGDAPEASPAAGDAPEVSPAAGDSAAADQVARARPTGRPATSKPGRVQVNPPGATPAAAPADVPLDAAVEGPNERGELLDRHAVGE